MTTRSAEDGVVVASIEAGARRGEAARRGEIAAGDVDGLGVECPPAQTHLEPVEPVGRIDVPVGASDCRALWAPRVGVANAAGEVVGSAIAPSSYTVSSTLLNTADVVTFPVILDETASDLDAAVQSETTQRGIGHPRQFHEGRWRTRSFGYPAAEVAGSRRLRYGDDHGGSLVTRTRSGGAFAAERADPRRPHLWRRRRSGRYDRVHAEGLKPRAT